MRRLLALLLTFAVATPVAAIELSLEENRAERGSIGYIDMQRLFKTFPETVRSQENFDEVVRQAEETINLHKAEIIRLRNELSQLKIEREFIARNPVVDVASPPAAAPTTAPAPVAAPAPAPAPPPASAGRHGHRGRHGEAPQAAPPAVAMTPVASTAPVAAVAASTAPAAAPPPRGQAFALAGLPGVPTPPPAATTPAPAPAKPEPLTINIPGVSTAPIVVQPPQAPATPKLTTTPFVTPPVVVATATTTAPSAGAPASPPLNAALVEIDSKIAAKARALAEKEAAFKEQQATAEKNLLDLESRKTEILLGKIYKAVQQVARKEGISVVVDKGNILYGHDAVDLTDKVLSYLKGEPY